MEFQRISATTISLTLYTFRSIASLLFQLDNQNSIDERKRYFAETGVECFVQYGVESI
jgi:hypothetical protein